MENLKIENLKNRKLKKWDIEIEKRKFIIKDYKIFKKNIYLS